MLVQALGLGQIVEAHMCYSLMNEAPEEVMPAPEPTVLLCLVKKRQYDSARWASSHGLDLHRAT